LLDRAPVAGQGARYGLLWSPINGPKSEPGASVDKTWQLLQISNPNHDRRLTEMAQYAQIRSLDNNGRLLPLSQTGVSTIQLVPVAMYSLSYPRVPLLLMDFFHPSRIRRRELSQQLLKDASAATLYFSWMPSLSFKTALALYQFIKRHQGFVVNEQKRLDSYSEARVDLAFGCCLDSAFPSDVQSRLAGISLNPLDSTIADEIASANSSYKTLMEASGPSGKLLQQLDKDRRQEIAGVSASTMTTFRHRLLHYSTLGSYTRRAPAGPNTIERTRHTRKQQDLINFLTQVTRSGTRPEVTYDPKKIEAAVQQLSMLSVTAKPEVNAVFHKLARELLILSSNDEIRMQCSRILAPESRRLAAGDEEIAGSGEPVVATQ
jgi:hypothetical protein